MRTKAHPMRMTRWTLVAALLGIIASSSFAQTITASPEQRRAIEAQIAFFQSESDAIRKASGFGRGPDVDDCALQAEVLTVTYICPAPTGTRDRVKSALVARGWAPAPVPTSNPWYALYAFRKGNTQAFFVCAPGRDGCLLELQQRN